ncbi:MAG: PIN domain-containing protein [Trueperaceae bacterium]|nr:MAG: PIN domain-containing protein [Trueperaceae bacterium]
MQGFTALLDACVLYPAPLRDLLMQLALTGLFHAKWSEAIHDEWIGNVLRNRPDLTHDQLERTRSLMNKHAGDCLVTDFEDLIPTLSLPDPKDHHVLAAAIRGRADLIVTYNLKDFPKATLRPYGLEAQHPDDFIMSLTDLGPASVLKAVQNQRANLQHPPKTADELLTILERNELKKTVSYLRGFRDIL